MAAKPLLHRWTRFMPSFQRLIEQKMAISFILLSSTRVCSRV